MSVTITVPDPLAAQLVSEAQHQQKSVDQLAVDLLTHILHENNDKAWDHANQQRLALLQKSSTNDLTREETDHLQQLQALADRRLEALDAERLAEVKRMEREVKTALRGTG